MNAKHLQHDSPYASPYQHRGGLFVEKADGPVPGLWNGHPYQAFAPVERDTWSEEIDDFLHWLHHAKRGSRRCYYRGFLPLDPMRVPDDMTHPVMPTSGGHHLALLVWNGYLGRLCLLTQCRHGPFDYSYLVVKT